MTTTSAAIPRPAVNPWVIAVVVAMAAFMEVLDTTIANVVLPYIGGALAVSSDEASWVVTTYLVANAVALTASSYLAKRFGRKRFFLICVALFTVSSVLCGLAWNLQSLLVFRIMQGLGGGGMVPVAQSILADAFPPEKRGQAFAMFGLAVVVAPVVGPTLGGYLADNVGWEWCFLVNGPIGIALMFLVWTLLPQAPSEEEERRKLKKEGLRFDLIGFLLVAIFLGSLEVILDRGLEDDWFGSSFIVIMTAICALAFALMIPWEFTRKNPVIDLRMVATRQFGACFVVMLMAGAILLATTQILPLLVQQNFGYTATWAGLMLSPGGVVTMMMVFLCGRLLGFVQPKYLIAVRRPDRRRRDVGPDQPVRRCHLLVFRLVAHLRRHRPAADPHSGSHSLLRRRAVRQDRSGLGADQCRSQHRRLHRHIAERQRAGTPRPVPSEPAGGKCDAGRPRVPGHPAQGDGVFHDARQLA